jgi:hypothetical protein
MKLRAMISSVALVSAMTISGGAFAQSMIGGVEVPAEQMQQFQEKCATLNSTGSMAAAPAETLAQPNDESDDATQTGSVVANGEDDPEATDGSELTAALEGLTVEQCKEAGL